MCAQADAHALDLSAELYTSSGAVMSYPCHGCVHMFGWHAAKVSDCPSTLDMF